MRNAQVPVPARVLGGAVPVDGGIDLDLPGTDVRLRGTRWPGRGNPVLLLHGLASQRRFWNLVVPGLAGLPVAVLDQRGHGDSERPERPYDLGSCADDVATALDALGWDRAVVVGHSWGAAVALTFAARHPERSLSAVVVDGGLGGIGLLDRKPGGKPGGTPDREALRARLAPPRLAVAPDELPALFSQGPLGPWWTPAHSDALLPAFAVGPDGLARARLPYDLHMRVLDGLLDYDAETTLAAVRCPVWAVRCEPGQPGQPGERAGDESWEGARQAAWDRAGRLLARPRLLRWGGALHDVPLQWPALVAGLVRAAVDDVSAGTRAHRPEGGPG
jgi:pimeloyl-ACP methyl ester carboxylesterase